MKWCMARPGNLIGGGFLLILSIGAFSMAVIGGVLAEGGPLVAGIALMTVVGLGLLGFAVLAGRGTLIVATSEVVFEPSWPFRRLKRHEIDHVSGFADVSKGFVRVIVHQRDGSEVKFLTFAPYPMFGSMEGALAAVRKYATFIEEWAETPDEELPHGE